MCEGVSLGCRLGFCVLLTLACSKQVPEIAAEAASSRPCIADTAAGHRVYTCHRLDFDVTVPDQCVGSPGRCGLVVDVHGFSMDAEMQDNNTDMRELGKRHGYLVIQPNANPGPPLSSWSDEDDPKVVDFVRQAITAWSVDQERVHFTGFSQGGAMTWRMICKHPDLFASVAPSALCDSAFGVDCFEAGSPPKREVPILYMHGMADARVDFSCAVPRVDAVTAAWKMTKQAVLQESSGHTWTRYENSGGSVFEFLQHDYRAGTWLIRGHCFPGSQDFQSSVSGQFFGFACVDSPTFVWGEEAMNFFIAHPRK